MDGEGLVLTTTTDTEAIVQAAAEGNEQGARIPGPQDSDSSVASYENEHSERRIVLERLAEHERELADLTAEPQQRIETNEPAGAEGEVTNGEEAAASVGIDMQAVRQRATADAIEAARARFAREQSDAFGRRMQELQQSTPDFSELVQQAGEIAIPSSCAETLRSRPGGAEAWLWLAANPQEAEKLLLWPERQAIEEVALLAARLDPAAQVRVTSRAPAPIRPLSGGGIRSIPPPDQLPYQEYRKQREQEIKAKYRR